MKLKQKDLSYYPSIVVITLGLGLLFGVPLFITSDFILDVFLMSFLFAYLSSAWNIIGGFTGQISVGHTFFYGIGAYTTMLTNLRIGLSPWFGLLIGGLLSAFLALTLGYPLFRLRGRYYVLATWAVAEISRLIFLAAKEQTGGAMGLWPPVYPDSWWHFQFHASRVPYYNIMLILLLACLVTSWKIRYSRLGRNMLAVREDEDAAESLGINTFRYKQIAIAISAFLTAIGGGFYAQYSLFIDPDTVMSTQISVDILFPAVLGGIGTVYGPIVGALLLVPAYWFLRVTLGYSNLHVIIRGVLLMLIVLLMPFGIVGSILDRFSKWTQKEMIRWSSFRSKI